jgi:hypothetical protein
MAGDNPVLESGSAAGEPSQTTIGTAHLLARNANGEIGNWDNAAEIRVVALENVIIERLAKLAKLYAAGPPKKELKALKDRIAAISKEVEAQDQGVALCRSGSTGEQARPRDPTREEDVGRDAFDQCIKRAQGAPQFSARIRAIEASIRVSAGPSHYKNKNKDDKFASNWSSIARSGLRPFAYLFIAALLGVGARVAWHYGGHEAKEMAKTWSSSLGWPSFASKKNTPPAPIKTAVATPLEVAPRLDPIRPGSAARRDSSEQPGAKKDLTTQSAPTPMHRIEQDNKPKKLSPPLDRSKAIPTPEARPTTTEGWTVHETDPKKLSPPSNRSKVIPTPEARPTTIEGWTVHEVSDGVAVLEGPNGIWRAKRGDEVPGVGRVESIVRWGSYWLVATSKGLISTP